jgi:hypothetical protein
MGNKFSIQPVGETEGSMLPLIRWLGLARLLRIIVPTGIFGINICEKIRRSEIIFPRPFWAGAHSWKSPEMK